jgi:hypothetical protein
LIGLRFNLDADLVKRGLSLKTFIKYFAVTIIIIASCDNEEHASPGIGLDYFPLQTGFYHIYDVESTQYTKGNDPIYETFEMLVEVVDSFASTTNEITYVIHRSTRPNSDAAWSVFDTWSARKNDRELVINEGNVPYLKLVFPVRMGSKWNPNKYNTRGADEIEITSLQYPFQLAGTTFDETLTVSHNDPDEIVFYDVREDIYAKGVGLIYKEVTQLNYCTLDHCKGQQKIDEGIEYKQVLKEYGLQ